MVNNYESINDPTNILFHLKYNNYETYAKSSNLSTLQNCNISFGNMKFQKICRFNQTSECRDVKIGKLQNSSILIGRILRAPVQNATDVDHPTSEYLAHGKLNVANPPMLERQAWATLLHTDPGHMFGLGGNAKR